MQPLPWESQPTTEHRSILFFRAKGSPNPFTMLTFGGTHITAHAAADRIREAANISPDIKLELTNARTDKPLDGSETKLPTYTYLHYTVSRAPVEMTIEKEKSYVQNFLDKNGPILHTNPKIRRAARLYPVVRNGVVADAVVERIKAQRGTELHTRTACGCCGYHILEPMQTQCCAAVMCAVCLQYVSLNTDSCPFCEAQASDWGERATAIPQGDVPNEHGLTAGLIAAFREAERKKLEKAGNG